MQFDRSDNVLVTIAAWDRPITDDLYALLKPLPGAVPAGLTCQTSCRNGRAPRARPLCACYEAEGSSRTSAARTNRTR